MCGNQTTSEMNTNHEQVQLCERDDAKVGSYSSACLDVLDPGPIDQGMFDKRFTAQRVYA